MRRPRRAAAIVTRSPEDSASLAARLRADGIEVIELPCVRIEQLADTSALAAAIARLAADDWLVVTSRAGADAVAQTLLPRSRVAAVGGRTAARLRERGIAVHFQPSVPSGEALARELPAARTALLARSDRALPDLPEILRARGFEVRETIAYRTVARAWGDVAGARAALGDPARAVRVFVSSPSAVDAFAGAVGDALAARATFVACGPTTANAVRRRIPDAAVELEEEALHAAHR